LSNSGKSLVATSYFKPLDGPALQLLCSGLTPQFLWKEVESVSTAKLESVPSSPASSDVPENGSMAWEHHAHLGDWIGVSLWLGCFAIIAMLHFFDMIGGLFGN
jgi:hypothetical protein